MNSSRSININQTILNLTRDVILPFLRCSPGSLSPEKEHLLRLMNAEFKSEQDIQNFTDYLASLLSVQQFHDLSYQLIKIIEVHNYSFLRTRNHPFVKAMVLHEAREDVKASQADLENLIDSDTIDEEAIISFLQKAKFPKVGDHFYAMLYDLRNGFGNPDEKLFRKQLVDAFFFTIINPLLLDYINTKNNEFIPRAGKRIQEIKQILNSINEDKIDQIFNLLFRPDQACSHIQVDEFHNQKISYIYESFNQIIQKIPSETFNNLANCYLSQMSISRSLEDLFKVIQQLNHDFQNAPKVYNFNYSNERIDLSDAKGIFPSRIGSEHQTLGADGYWIKMNNENYLNHYIQRPYAKFKQIDHDNSAETGYWEFRFNPKRDANSLDRAWDKICEAVESNVVWKAQVSRRTALNPQTIRVYTPHFQDIYTINQVYDYLTSPKNPISGEFILGYQKTNNDNNNCYIDIGTIKANLTLYNILGLIDHAAQSKTISKQTQQIKNQIEALYKYNQPDLISLPDCINLFKDIEPMLQDKQLGTRGFLGWYAPDAKLITLYQSILKEIEKCKDVAEISLVLLNVSPNENQQRQPLVCVTH